MAAITADNYQKFHLGILKCVHGRNDELIFTVQVTHTLATRYLKSGGREHHVRSIVIMIMMIL